MNNLPNNDSIINAPTHRRQSCIFYRNAYYNTGSCCCRDFAKNGHYTKRIPPQGEGAGLICMAHEKMKRDAKPEGGLPLKWFHRKSIN